MFIPRIFQKNILCEKNKSFFVFKEVIHSNHSDLSLKYNSLSIENDVALIFHYAALISKGRWETKVVYSKGCRCQNLSW